MYRKTKGRVHKARPWVSRGLAAVIGVTAWLVMQPTPAKELPGSNRETVIPAIEILRTTDDIPHIRATSWHGLGQGMGYVQAQDALCTLAEGFVTYEGQRSWFFGPEAYPALRSSVGLSKNIDSDFFFKAFVDDVVIESYRSAQPTELRKMVDGFAAGYNQLLREAKSQPQRFAYRDCLQASWVREIAPEDLYRRMYASQVRAGYGQFVTELVNSMPGMGHRVEVGGMNELRTHLAGNLGEDRTLGSNVIAWGQRATGDDGAVLFGNPHWFWGGPDRFYQMHLTIPGELNVAGVSFLGIPVVMIGFTENVAWSHTVSRARRFGLFELTLDPSDSRRYLVDGVSETMRTHTVSVDVQAKDGTAQSVSRTLYTTRYGPVLDLGRRHESLGWSDQRVLTIRDVNAENYRTFRNFLEWGKANSLEEFIRIQRQETSMPWVNTVAIGRNDGRVWYADVGAIPNAPDSLRKTCLTPAGETFAQLDPSIPVLDGSRAVCNWLEGKSSVQTGAMPPDDQPQLLREDYVANMNDSHWLTNVNEPLTGFASLFGGEGQALGLRGRLGHQIAIELLQERSSSSESLSRRVMQEVLNPRVLTADQFKPILLDQACSHSAVKAQEGWNLDRACQTLRAWGNTAEVGDRGAILWEAFWSELKKLTSDGLFQVSFSSEAPLSTPAFPSPGPDNARRALTNALAYLSKQGISVDAAYGDIRHVNSGGRRWAMYGGCAEVGSFVVNCPRGESQVIGPDAISNSYLQVVRFGVNGVDAHTLLAHGQDELAVANGRGSAPVVRYARKAWLAFPFSVEDIQRDPELVRSVLQPQTGAELSNE